MPSHVREALAAPVTDLRHPRFLASYQAVRAGVRAGLDAEGFPVVLASGSGSFGLELVVRAAIAPGERAMAVVTGIYGSRLARMAELAGAEVLRLESRLGEVPGPGELAEALSRDPVAWVLLVHVEPSTGTQVDLPGLARVAREAGAVPIVDAICSAFALRVECRAWGLGAVVTASQKGLALPPGMAVAAVSPEVAARAERAPEVRTGSYGRLAAWTGEGFVFTPPMLHILAAEASLAHIAAETMAKREARHLAQARRVRTFARDQGLVPVAVGEDSAAGTLTALRYPPGCDDAWLRALRDDRGLELAPATDPRIAGKGFRVGHLGDLPDEHLEAGLGRLASALGELP